MTCREALKYFVSGGKLFLTCIEKLLVINPLRAANALMPIGCHDASLLARAAFMHHANSSEVYQPL